MHHDRVYFKTIYGYITATPAGLNGATSRLTSLQKFWLGLPGKEDGLAAKPGLMYGEAVWLINHDNDYLTAGPNGWGNLKPHTLGWSKFLVLSPLHKTGLVSYGDVIMLRAHNGKILSTGIKSPWNLEAVDDVATEEGIFRIVGKTGVVHNHDQIALRSPHKGYIAAGLDTTKRAIIDHSGHY